MNLRINKLMLQNFKGIKSLEINAGGDNLTIYGDNATGKTTVFDAFMWLLFNKDSLGRSDFGIKTQDEYGNVIHNLEHSVECEMMVDDAVLTLKKVFTEKWTKKRGSADAEFTGHETKYFVNEVPTLKKDYDLKIASVIDEELFKVITNPLYFNEHLKWQDRRAILLNLCNNLTDEEIIAQSQEFNSMLEELQGRTVAEYKKIIQSKQTAINDELKAIPQRISEASLAIPENVESVDETEKALIEQKIAKLTDEINAIKNGAGATDIEVEIRALKEKKKQIQSEVCDISGYIKTILELKNKIADAELEVNKCKSGIANADYIIAEYEQKAESLRKQWYEVKEKQYTDNGICPTCGQAFPEEQIEKAKAKFNTERAEQLETITEQGKKAREVCLSHMAEKKRCTDKMNEVQGLIDAEYKPQIQATEETMNKVKAEFEVKCNADISVIDNQIAEAEKRACNSTEDIQASIYPIQEQINAEKAKIAEIDKAIAGRDLMARQKQRIAELEADEKRLATEYSKLDATAFLIDKFIKYKVDLLSEEINSHFKYAKFKLFDVQINGGISECCEVTYRGVPYSDLNNAAKINIGIDIINTLCKLNDKYAPVITDNAESVTNILPTTSQMICLVVSAEDRALRVEKGV